MTTAEQWHTYFVVRMPTTLSPFNAWRIMLISRASNKFSGSICPGNSTKPVTGRIGICIHWSSGRLLGLTNVLPSKNTLSHHSGSTFCHRQKTYNKNIATAIKSWPAWCTKSSKSTYFWFTVLACCLFPLCSSLCYYCFYFCVFFACMFATCFDKRDSKPYGCYGSVISVSVWFQSVFGIGFSWFRFFIQKMSIAIHITFVENDQTYCFASNHTPDGQHCYVRL